MTPHVITKPTGGGPHPVNFIDQTPVDAVALSRTLELDEVDAAVDSGAPTLDSISLFRGCSRDALGEVLGASQRRIMQTGESLFAEGQPTRSIFAVMEGALEIHRPNREWEVARVRSGECTGLFGLLAGRRRATHARALARTELFEIPAGSLLRLITRESSVRNAVKLHFNERLASLFCSSSLLFGDGQLDHQREQLARAFVPTEHPIGRGLMLVEPQGTALYVVSHGRMRLSSPSLPEPLSLSRGQFFGISGGSVTVEPLTRVSLLELSPRRSHSQLLRELGARAREARLFVDRHVFVGDTGIVGLA